MNPGEYNIIFNKGATFSLELEAEDDLGLINFQATYTRAELKVWPSITVQKGVSGTPLLEMSTENLKIVLGEDNVVLQMSSEETSVLGFREGVYELKLINDSTTPDIIDKLIFGKVFVRGL